MHFTALWIAIIFLLLLDTSCSLDMRLSSGHEGRLEILRTHGWSAICDRGWNIKAAIVACKSMRFLSADELYLGLSNKDYGMFYNNELYAGH